MSARICQRCGDAFGPHEHVGILTDGRLLVDNLLCRRCVIRLLERIGEYMAEGAARVRG